MKAYLSYWGGGYQNKPNEFVLNMHKVCVFLAKKHFKEVHFLVDEQYKNDFKDISFNSINTFFHNLDLKYSNVWSISKLLVYKHLCQKGDPFIHIDYDVFLWNGIPEKLQKANVFAQSEEHNSYYWYGIDKFLQYCPKPYVIGDVNPKPEHGINVGIFGGNNLDFIQKYSQQALNIIFDKENENLLLGENIFDHHWNRAVIIEQYGLACACKHYNVKPELYFENGWPGNEEASHKKYTHLMGAKQCEDVRKKINLFAQKIKNAEQNTSPTNSASIQSLTKPKYKLSVGAIFYNEAPYLKEWLLHYLYRGVEHFYLINDGSTDNFENVIAPFKDKITIFNVAKRENYNLRQKHLYNYYFLNILKDTEWFILCDIDEYIWSPKYLNLQQACNTLEKDGVNYIGIPMVLFGSNGHKEQPRSIVHGFTKRSNIDEEYMQFVRNYAQYKALAKSSEIKEIGIHHFEVNCEKKLQELTDLNSNLFRLNHYRLQSEEKWRKGLSKPDVNCFVPKEQNNLDPHAVEPVPINNTGNYRTMEMFYAFNKTQNSVEDMGLVEQNLKYNL